MEKLEKLFLTKITLIPLIIFFKTIYQIITNNGLRTEFFFISIILLLIIDIAYLLFRKEIKWKTKNYPKKITQLININTTFQTIFLLTSLINLSLNENFLHLLNPLLLIITILPLLLIFKYEFDNINKLYK